MTENIENKTANPPEFGGVTIYLDQNIYGRCLDQKNDFDKRFYALMQGISKDKNVKILYSASHVFETSKRSNQDNIQKELALIKELTKDNFIEYREDLDCCTIKPRDPFECHNTINFNPCEVIASIAKQFEEKPEFRQEIKDRGMGKDELVRYFESLKEILKSFSEDGSILKILPEGYAKEVLKLFSEGGSILKILPSILKIAPEGYEKEFRDYLNIEKQKISNFNTFPELLDFINRKLRSYFEERLKDPKYKEQYQKNVGHCEPPTFDSLIDLALKNNPNLNNANREQRYVISINWLKSSGYSSSKGEKIESREGELYDAMHAFYPCHIFISEDKKLIKLKSLLGGNAMNRKDFIKKYCKRLDNGTLNIRFPF